MTPHTKGSASPLYCMSWTETEAPADLPKGIECIYLLKWGVHVPKFRYIFLIWPPENTRIDSRNNIHNPHNMAFVKYRIKTWDSLPPTRGGTRKEEQNRRVPPKYPPDWAFFGWVSPKKQPCPAWVPPALCLKKTWWSTSYLWRY